MLSSTDTLVDNTSLATGCPYKPSLHEHSSATTIRASSSSDERGPSPPASDSSSSLAPSVNKCPIIMTQEIDEQMLRHHLPTRIAYLTDYLNFGLDDAEAIMEVAPLVNDVIPGMVDGMYAKLFEFDITKKIFMKRNKGFVGDLPKRLEDLTLESPQIVFRKVFMKSWARRVLTADYTQDQTWIYMDKVGVMHTGASPFKHQRSMGIAPLNVPYRDCALLLGHVLEVLQTAIFSLPDEQLSREKKVISINAINKVIWIQNDLFARHYIPNE